MPNELPGHIQDGIQYLHATTGMPWWLSIACSTLIVRSALLPLARKQIMLSEKFSVALRDMLGVAHVFRSHVKSRAKETSSSVPKVAMQELPEFIKSLRDVNEVHGTSFSGVVLPTVVNAGVFISFVLSVRWMMYDPRFIHTLQEGGIWWFEDLTKKDNLLYLPVAASLVNYFSLDYFFPKKNSSEFSLKLKDGLQMVVICTISAIVDLPSGVFMYWIPSGLFTIGQRYLFTTNRTRELLGMGPMSTPQVPSNGALASKDENAPTELQEGEGGLTSKTEQK
jgi:YidC/Oxa1 family membrane protein insertase